MTLDNKLDHCSMPSVVNVVGVCSLLVVVWLSKLITNYYVTNEWLESVH